MKKTILSLLLILLSLNLALAEECEDILASSEAVELSKVGLPNCFNNKNFKFAERGKSQSLCLNCRDQFEKRYPGSIAPLSKKEIQERAFEASINEYKKSIVSNIMDVVRLRGLQNTGSNFSESLKACKKVTTEEFSKGCSSPAAKKLLTESSIFLDLDKSIGNEVARLISTDKNFDPIPSLLKRSQASTCEFPEKDVLLFSAMAAEDMFSGELVKNLIAQDGQKFNSTREMFEKEKIPLELFEAMETHPLMKQYAGSPESLITFLKTIPSPVTPQGFKSALYNKKAGNKLDHEIAQNCSKSLEAFKGTICSGDFEKGAIRLDPFKNLAKISSKELKPSPLELAASQELVDSNLEVLKLCENESQTGLDLTSKLANITPGLSDHSKKLNYSSFATLKFTDEVGNLKDQVCQTKDSDCLNKETLTCAVYRRYKESQNKQSFDSKLASSSNPELNELLRSMIGETKKLDPKTKEILISQGIIPQDNGSFVSQPDIPERKADFFSKPQVAQATKKFSANTSVVTPSSSSAQSFANPYFPPSQINQQENQGPEIDLSGIMKETSELKNIQDEIKRRLMGLPNNKPAGTEEAKKIVRESFKARNKTPTPYEETAMAERLMELPERVIASAPVSSSFNDENKASVSPTDKDKLSKQRMNEALANMAGANEGMRAEATSTAQEGSKLQNKELTKVALNTPEDPKVSLSELLIGKLQQNDPKTKEIKALLKTKSNFILQVKDMNFKVVFNEKNDLQLIHESGNKEEALKARPQIEIFLKSLL